MHAVSIAGDLTLRQFLDQLSSQEGIVPTMILHPSALTENSPNKSIMIYYNITSSHEAWMDKKLIDTVKCM